MKYKELFKKIEQAVSSLEICQDTGELIHKVLKTVLAQYGPALRIISGRLYKKEGGMYRVIKQIGGDVDRLEGAELPEEYLPIRKLRENKYIIMRASDRDIDDRFREYLVLETFAAIALGENDQYLAAFGILEPCNEVQLHYSLNTIRFVTNMKLRELTLQNEFLKAREIQRSLLPSISIERKGFDIYGKTVPADLVGGDAYDYLPISDDSLGIAVLDAVGHGLPAALQARDAITGLRMGTASNLKIVNLISRLNKVIHKSNLSSRFVSLFYGELEEIGYFVYTNAGHPPPLILTKGRFIELKRGGMVLGPNPQAKYKRGFVYFNRGDVMIIYSDGITEARNPAHEMFGIHRLKKELIALADKSARDIVNGIFSAVNRFSTKDIPEDDQTVVIIKRTEWANNRY